MKKLVLVALASAAFMGTNAEAATIIPFTFTASNGIAGTSGSGSFTSSKDSGAIALADLTAFSLTGTASAFIAGGSYAFSGVGDLTSFAATISGGALTTANFATVVRSFDVSAFGFPLGTTTIQLAASGFGPGNLTATNPFVSGTGNLTYGTLTAAVPEPAAWAMMIGGVGMVGGAMRRKRAKVNVRVAYA